MTSFAIRVKYLLLAIAFGLVSPTPARAASNDDVLRLVPPDTTVCFVVRDLRTHAEAFLGSPFAKWLQSSGFAKQVADPDDLKKFKQATAILTTQLNVTPEQLRDDLLGDLVVFAYQAATPGKADDESGLLLLNARKPELLATLITKLNDLQTASGEVRAVREKRHRERAYFERTKSDDSREYYLLRGGVFVFANREATLLRVIEREIVDRDETNPLLRGLKRLELEKTFAVCWFNPRGFDAAVRAQTEAAMSPGDRAFLRQFGKLWDATEHLAVFLQPDRGAELGLLAAVDEAKVPDELRPALFPPPGGSNLWAVVPDDAILATGGRLHIPQLLAALETFLPDEVRATWKGTLARDLAPLVGKEKLAKLMTSLGPDWAMWVRPPDADGSWAPSWAVALRLGEDAAQAAEVARILLPALDFAAQLARFEHNRKHMGDVELTEEKQGDVAVKTLSSGTGFPKGFRPSYAVKAGHLVLASSPEVVKQFDAPREKSGDEPPLLRISASRLRAYLAKHRSALAAVQAKSGEKTAETIEKELQQFALVLEPFEKIELRYGGAKGRVKLSLQIEFVQPLKK